jgi:hypothetical protein
MLHLTMSHMYVLHFPSIYFCQPNSATDDSNADQETCCFGDISTHDYDTDDFQ